MATVFKRGGSKAKGPWYAAWQDHNGKRITKCTQTTDKAAAERIAKKREAAAALRREGVIDPNQERLQAQSQRPLTEQLADFETVLKSRERTPKHVRTTQRHIQWVLDTSGIEYIKDLSSAVVSRSLGELRKGGASLRTCNSYMQSITSFTRWVWKEKRASYDPLTSLTRFNEATDVRHERRAMTSEEVAYLLRFTESHTTANHSLCGPDRAMVYRIALSTGFRANEIRSLSPSSFRLSQDSPFVVVEAGYSKRRRRDEQPIRNDLADNIRKWLAGKPTGEPLFNDLPGDTARMLRSDLRSARKAWIDEADDAEEIASRERSEFLAYVNSNGEFADFHSTRHTYITDLVAGGTNVKVAQELARHSTSRLTVDRYAHVQADGVAAALESLPSTVMFEQPEPLVRECDDSDAQRQAQRAAVCLSQNGAIGCDEEGSSEGDSESHKDLPCNDLRFSAEENEERRRSESNRRWRICNPLP